MRNIVITTILGCCLAATANAQWRTSVDKDPITGEVNAYAISQGYTSTEPMSFPYQGVTMSVGYGCSKESEWAYFFFSEAPNITNDDTQSGYNTSTSRIRWDDTASTIALRQDWGERSMHFRDKDNIRKIRSSNKLILELHWHSQSEVYFEVPLSGSTRAINAARNDCGLQAHLDEQQERRAEQQERRAEQQAKQSAYESAYESVINDIENGSVSELNEWLKDNGGYIMTQSLLSEYFWNNPDTVIARTIINSDLDLSVPLTVSGQRRPIPIFNHLLTSQRFEHNPILRRLLFMLIEESKVDINAKYGLNEFTALHYAAIDEDAELARALLAAGADPLILSKYDASVLSLSKDSEVYDVIKDYIDNP